MDEAFSAVLVRGSFVSMIKGSFSDTLPFLYNIIAWAMTHIFGYSAAILKFTSVIPMILLLLLGCTNVKRDFGLMPSVIFILCIISVPEMFHYGVEIRMYSYALLFATASGIYAFECFASSSRRSWVLLSCATILGALTHYFALITSAFVWLFLLIMIIRHSSALLKKWCISASCTVVSYVPFFIVAIIQLKKASSYFSAKAPDANGFFSALRSPFVTNITPLSAVLLLLFLFALIFGSRQPVSYMYCSAYVLILIVSYLIMYITGSTFFSSRYLFPAYGLLWLGFAIASGREWHTHIPALYTYIAVFLVLSVTGATNFRSQFIREYCTGVDKMTDFFDANLTENDGYIIYEDNYQIEICMRYYEPGLKKYDFDSACDISGNIWYFEVPGYEKELDAAGIYGYNKEYIGDMSFSIYSFKLYKLTKATDN